MDNLTILQLKHSSISQEILVYLRYRQQKKFYNIKIVDDGILGVETEVELEDIITQNPRISKLFIELVLRFYKGENIVLPLELGELTLSNPAGWALPTSQGVQ